MAASRLASRGLVGSSKRIRCRALGRPVSGVPTIRHVKPLSVDSATTPLLPAHAPKLPQQWSGSSGLKATSKQELRRGLGS
ncbi:MAG: hypothetical protein ACYSWW_20070, partial [Planctomycetota bacterium]